MRKYLVKWRTDEAANEAIMSLEEIAFSPKESFRMMVPLIARRHFQRLTFDYGFIYVSVVVIEQVEEENPNGKAHHL